MKNKKIFESLVRQIPRPTRSLVELMSEQVLEEYRGHLHEALTSQDLIDRFLKILPDAGTSTPVQNYAALAQKALDTMKGLANRAKALTLAKLAMKSPKLQQTILVALMAMSKIAQYAVDNQDLKNELIGDIADATAQQIDDKTDLTKDAEPYQTPPGQSRVAGKPSASVPGSIDAQLQSAIQAKIKAGDREGAIDLATDAIRKNIDMLVSTPDGIAALISRLTTDQAQKVLDALQIDEALDSDVEDEMLKKIAFAVAKTQGPQKAQLMQYLKMMASWGQQKMRRSPYGGYETVFPGESPTYEPLE